MTALATRLLSTAASTPHRVAIVDAALRVTYAELCRMAQRFAGFLAFRGVAHGASVAIVLPNGLQAVVARYGAWLAGCVAVPLDPQAPSAELATWLRSAAPAIVVRGADSGAVDAAIATLTERPVSICTGSPGTGPEQLQWSDAMAVDVVPMPRPLSLEEVATIVYTSGTTAAPKGVALTHGNLASNVEAIIAYLQLRGEDSTVLALPLHYAYGASVLHTHLAAGACVVLEDGFVFPHQVVASMARERVSGFSGVSSTFALLLDRVDLSQHVLTSLRYLTHAGGPMPATLAARVRAAFPDAEFFTMYGQTEATARLTWLPPSLASEKGASVGKAIDGVLLEVRDEHGRQVPSGVTGDIWARGPGVMAGYWNDPTATSCVLRGGWLRTGDMGWLDEDGFLTLSGRRSDMIKTGAHRVHPGDVEEAIRELPAVVDVAVAGIADARLGQVIGAFVVLAEGASLDPNAVRKHCRGRLSGYKVPKSIAFVACLPRTSSGKVQRHRLAMIDGTVAVP